MPTYSYRCEKCGILELVQSISEPSLTSCPNCDSPVRRVIGKNVLVLFKGSGFYCTDSRNSTAAALNGGSSDSASDSAAEPKSTLSETRAATEAAV